VVSLQNGMALGDLEALVGADRSVGCVIGWGATLHPDGAVELTSEGTLRIGSRSKRVQARLEPIRAALSAAFPTAIVADIFAEQYSKLAINACFTGLGVISGRTLGWMLVRRRYRDVFIGIVREAIAVAGSLGVRVPPYAGRLDYYAFLRGPGRLARLRRHAFVLLLGVKHRRLKSSSLTSLERGRPTEIDALNGWISRTGREKGVPTPLNDRLAAMVHEIESGSRPIGVKNIHEPLPGLDRVR
jgi:2-dehydropantoate 2-reductase